MSKRLLLLAAITTTILAANAASAMAAGGLAVCVGGPGTQLQTPKSAGVCSKGTTLTQLATEAEVTTLQGQVSTLQTDDTTLQGQVSTLQGQVSTLQTDNSNLKSDVSALQTTLTPVSYDPNGSNSNGKPTLTITGANVQILSGSGATNGDKDHPLCIAGFSPPPCAPTVNGLGNLFIGYDESPSGSQTGSNNLILGLSQAFTSYGDVVDGRNNTATGPYATAFGQSNTASGPMSLTAGDGNAATGLNASVLGGFGNVASGLDSSVSGGAFNTSSGNCQAIPSAPGSPC